jgi:hypothetical protein
MIFVAHGTYIRVDMNEKWKTFAKCWNARQRVAQQA